MVQDIKSNLSSHQWLWTRHSLLPGAALHLHNTSGLHKAAAGKIKNKKIQTHFRVAASPQHFPGHGSSQPKEPKASSWLPNQHQKQLPPGFCDFIQGHRYHSRVFKRNSQHLIPSTSNHHHGWNTELAQKEKDLVLPQFMKLKDNPPIIPNTFVVWYLNLPFTFIVGFWVVLLWVSFEVTRVQRI